MPSRSTIDLVVCCLLAGLRAPSTLWHIACGPVVLNETGAASCLGAWAVGSEFIHLQNIVLGIELLLGSISLHLTQLPTEIEVGTTNNLNALRLFLNWGLKRNAFLRCRGSRAHSSISRMMVRWW